MAKIRIAVEGLAQDECELVINALYTGTKETLKVGDSIDLGFNGREEIRLTEIVTRQAPKPEPPETPAAA